jgi:hypothetical protein
MFCLAALVALPALAQEKVDLSVMHRIRAEAFGQSSKAMDYLFYLTDVYGPRLANSPGYKTAGDWVVKQLKENGFANVRQEKWGPFGPGWQCTYYAGHIIEPTYQPLIAMPVAWTPGTNGVLTGEAMMAIVQSPADFPKYKGKLKGKIVLTTAPREVALTTTPMSTRYTPEELAEITQFQIPGAFGRGGRAGSPAGGPQMTMEEMRKLQNDIAEFLIQEQPALVIQESRMGFGGTLFGGGANRNSKDNPPTVVMAAEHYNRIARLLQHTPPVPVKLQFDIKNQTFDQDQNGFNITAEIPGNSKKNEVVMVGGHLDSWHYGTGAADNAVGSAVALEVMRILKSLNLRMDRTVRVGLWDAEEEGLLGSAA